MRAHHLTRTPGQRTTAAMLKRLLVSSIAVLFAVSCTNEHKSLTGPTKGLAHIPSFSTSSTTSSGATFTTDKDDYSPGETALLSGTGWQPADVLDIHLTVDPVTHDPVDWTVAVDSSGSFTSSYLVQDTDAGTTLTITATSPNGESATAMFTDVAPCPNVNAIGNFVTSSRVGATATLNTTTATYTFESFVTEGSGGVPGLIEYCVYSDHSPTGISVDPQLKGANSAAWTDQTSAGEFSFVRPDGDPSNIAYDGQSHTMGTATFASGQTGNFDRIVLHINDAAECTRLYGGTPGTCFVFPGQRAHEAEAPTVSKDASGSYDRECDWTITKSVDPTLVQRTGGGTVNLNYTVVVSATCKRIENVKVTGTITVHNPNAADLTLDDVTDQLSDGKVCTVTKSGGLTVPANGDKTFPYSCDLSAYNNTNGTVPPSNLTNKVTITWSDQTLSDGSHLAGGSGSFTSDPILFSETLTDECVNVTDDQKGTVGSFCVTAAGGSKTFTYSVTVNVPQFDCVTYKNTATFTDNSTPQNTNSASASAKVCGPAKTGALTIGFWKTTNGQNLIKTYCQNPALANYLRGLGAGSGPFSNAPTTSCTDLASYVYGILNAASATDMNKMLKAQMLGTALDVWFSGPGWTSTKIGGVKPPSNFLSNNSLGTFNMDTKAVCAMVDNTSTGTATCLNNTPSTDAVASGAVPTSPMSMQAILKFAATVDVSPWINGAFTGTALSSTWYGTDRTKQEILKNIFDQFNNQLAFGSF